MPEMEKDLKLRVKKNRTNIIILSIIVFVCWVLIGISSSIGLVSLVIIPSTFGFLFCIVCLIMSIYRFNRANNQYFKYKDELGKKAMERALDPTIKTRVVGMIKVRKQIDILKTSEELGVTPEKIKAMIYGLLGGGKIEGQFTEGNIFKIQGNMDVVLVELDKQFSSWDRNIIDKNGKI
nr:hypothetical protein [Candidatus Sigynarchaeota archaeon]